MFGITDLQQRRLSTSNLNAVHLEIVVKRYSHPQQESQKPSPSWHLPDAEEAESAGLLSDQVREQHASFKLQFSDTPDKTNITCVLICFITV